MIGTFDIMRKIDVSAHVEKRDGMDYLNWAKCVDLLHEHGAQIVYFTPLVNDNGSSLFMSDREFTDSKGNINKCYEVAVDIVIDDLEFVMRSPLLNGSNPVKDNSMSQQRVWNAQTRAFVKGVAIRTGLGFSLWSNDIEGESKEPDLYKHDIGCIKTRVQEIYTQKLKKKMSVSDIAKALEMTEDEVKAYFSYYDTLARFEQKLSAL